MGWRVEHHDPKLAGVECRAGAASNRLIQRIGVVRHEHHSRLPVLAPGIVGHHQSRRPRSRTQYLLQLFRSMRTFASR